MKSWINFPLGIVFFVVILCVFVLEIVVSMYKLSNHNPPNETFNVKEINSASDHTDIIIARQYEKFPFKIVTKKKERKQNEWSAAKDI